MAAGKSSYVVVLNDSVTHPGRVAERQARNLGVEVNFVYGAAFKGYAALMTPAEARSVAGDPQVSYVEPDEIGKVTAQTVPTGIKRIFALSNAALDIDEVDDLRANVDVAVLDTGIAVHSDLNVAGRVNCLVGETCEAVKEGTGNDSNGHGTLMAGAIGAIDNTSGVVGVAPGARLWGVKVADATGASSVSEYVAGLNWVIAHAKEIEVSNSSLRFSATESTKALTTALKSAAEAGVVEIASAGNDNADASKYVPANDANVMTVSAIADYNGKPLGEAPSTCANWGADDFRFSTSNYGTDVDITAPGACILSTTLGGATAETSGTSIATAEVSGAAALLAAKSNPNNLVETEEIRDRVRKLGNFEWTDNSGDGVKEPLLDVSHEEDFKLK